ncbi:MAG: sensor histidine kinase [Synergistetes bacterium]|nr:sensor histidine kinase [Synergistota bacterium]MDW8192988.1 histidine kinase [Synergistota bacterium]
MKENILGLLMEIQNRVQSALEEACNEVHSMWEKAREELQRLYLRRKELSIEIDMVIKDVDEAQQEFEKARQWLVEVRSDFSKYGERDIKEAYAMVERKQLEFLGLREKERALRKERDLIDKRVRELEDLVGKIDNLFKRIRLAFDLLAGNMERVEKELLELKGRAEMAPLLVQVLEKERRRVAREVHDGPAQYLANAVFRLDMCEHLLKEGVVENALKEINNLKEMLKTNLSDIRRFISDLRPMVLEDLGLIPALRKYIDDWAKLSGIKVDFRVHGEENDTGGKEIEIALFRIVQEALSNVYKHAQASSVRIVIEVGNDFVGALIQDNGLGFDLYEVKKLSVEKGSLGIFSMEERAKALRGTFKIFTEKGKGTKIVVRIPKGGLGV